MKQYAVQYQITEQYFVVVEANDPEEAKAKVTSGEIDHGDALYVEGSWEFDDFTSVKEVLV
jgi:hypothetical protein